MRKIYIVFTYLEASLCILYLAVHKIIIIKVLFSLAITDPNHLSRGHGFDSHPGQIIMW